jgi:DNA gyrase subunit A
LIDIKTSKRNGRVIGIVPVTDDDELLMMTNRGKIQRVAAKEINIIGRNTQGVKIMNLTSGDLVVDVARVVKEDEDEVEDDDDDTPSPAPKSKSKAPSKAKK